MSERPPASGKINTGVEGLGLPTPEMVEERARELARCDGRAEPNENDRSAARLELQGPVEPQLPEAPPEVESITEWDESPESAGNQAPNVLPEDEAVVGAVLVEEGVEEADHELRVSAAEENPPEEV